MVKKKRGGGSGVYMLCEFSIYRPTTCPTSDHHCFPYGVQFAVSKHTVCHVETHPAGRMHLGVYEHTPHVSSAVKRGLPGAVCWSLGSRCSEEQVPEDEPLRSHGFRGCSAHRRPHQRRDV